MGEIRHIRCLCAVVMPKKAAGNSLFVGHTVRKLGLVRVNDPHSMCVFEWFSKSWNTVRSTEPANCASHVTFHWHTTARFLRPLSNPIPVYRTESVDSLQSSMFFTTLWWAVCSADAGILMLSFFPTFWEYKAEPVKSGRMGTGPGLQQSWNATFFI